MDLSKKSCGWMILLAACLTIVVIWSALFMSNNRTEGYQMGGSMGYSSLSRKLPQYEAIPDILTAIGGRKGKFNYSQTQGLYPSDKSHLRTGAPYKKDHTRTIIRPELVGFSANSFINRDTYGDMWNAASSNRKLNPNFRYITKFNGINLFPSRYSTAQYRFSSI